MSLHITPKSILDRPNPPHQDTVFGTEPNTLRPTGTEYVDAVVDEHTTNNTEHHEAQHAALFRGTEGHPVHDGSDYPRHVHSTKHHGDHWEVKDAEAHAKALESGLWSDTPLEVLKDK